MNNEKIKQSEVAALRVEMLAEQEDKCALCGFHCEAGEAALDHCHNTGRVRGVLHSSCNILLGKVENFVGRYGKRLVKFDRLEGALNSMHEYMIADYTDNPLHFKHKTEEDKLLLKYRRLKRRSKKPETKQKYEDLIKEITDARSER